MIYQFISYIFKKKVFDTFGEKKVELYLHVIKNSRTLLMTILNGPMHIEIPYLTIQVKCFITIFMRFDSSLDS